MITRRMAVIPGVVLSCLSAFASATGAQTRPTMDAGEPQKMLLWEPSAPGAPCSHSSIFCGSPASIVGRVCAPVALANALRHDKTTPGITAMRLVIISCEPLAKPYDPAVSEILSNAHFSVMAGAYHFGRRSPFADPKKTKR